jgi:hypothetical protein
MLVVVHLVAEEDRPPLVAEEPDAVVRGLARPEVEECEASAEVERLAVRDPLDEVRVDERAVRSCGMAVDANVRCHAATTSSGRPWRPTTRS